MTKARFDKSVRYDAGKINCGGRRIPAMAKRLRQMKERHKAGLDPFTGARVKMPTNPGHESDR